VRTTPRYELAKERKTPDWTIVNDEGSPTLVLEVVTAHAPKVIEDETTWLTELQLRLSRVSQFCCDLVITHTSMGMYHQDHDLVIQHIDTWLSGLVAKGSKEGSTTFVHDKGSLCFETLPRVPPCPGPIRTVLMGPMQWVDIRRLTEIVREKLTKYQYLRDAGIPFVLAVHCDIDCMFDTEDLITVLFGQLVYHVGHADDRSIPLSSIREADGLLSGGGSEYWAGLRPGFPNAVLWLDLNAKKTAWLVRNPWAENRLPVSSLVPAVASDWRVVEVPVPEDVLARGA
jgi:hypothetical protein